MLEYTQEDISELRSLHEKREEAMSLIEEVRLKMQEAGSKNELRDIARETRNRVKDMYTGTKSVAHDYHRINGVIINLQIQRVSQIGEENPIASA